MNRLLKNYCQEVQGNVAIMFAGVLIPILVILSLGLDSTINSNTLSRSQNLGDNLALLAAVKVHEDGEIPNDRNEGYLGTYTATELGYKFPATVEDGSNDVKVNVSYDDNRKVSIVKIYGTFRSTFGSIVNRNSHPFETTSEANYGIETLQKPISIALVIDDSQSMQWDDRIDPNQNNDEFERYSTTPNAKRRIDAVREAVEGLMDELEIIETTASEEGEDRVIRTGLYSFTESFNEDHSSRLTWGTYSNGVMPALNALTSRGSTNSASAMEEVKTDMHIENTFHRNENGQSNPHKYTILLSDGANQKSQYISCEYRPRPTHKHWYYSYKRSNNPGAYVYSYTQHGRYKLDFEGQFVVQDWTHMTVAAGEEYERVCETEWGNDTRTVQICKELADQGGKVFTVGFGIKPGWYHRNNGIESTQPERVSAIKSGGAIQDRYHAQVLPDASQRAETMLKECAETSGGKYFSADNAEELKEAFLDVGRTITDDSIRITN